MAVNNGSGAGNAPKKSFKLYGVIFLVVAAGGVAVWLNAMRGGESNGGDMAVFAAKRGPLRISVLESGTIKAREQEVIFNQVEGRTTIVKIVPEGTIVKEGDVLVELDVSTLKDSQIDQDIRVRNAEASWINSKENFEIVKSQAISDVNVAELNLLFAKQDLRKYREGEYPNQLESAESEITLSKETLARADQTLQWSERLFKEKYIAETELQGDRLSRNRARVDVNISQNKLELLQKFTYIRQIAQLESDVRQAEMALERIQRKANANKIQAEADLRAKEQEYNRQKDKLAKIDDQLQKARVIAPKEGMVIYATSAQSGGGGRMRMDNRQPLQEGVEVFERQELIYLPTAASSKAEVAIHEASMQKVRVGLPAVITIDALQGKQFFGEVKKIAPLPDPQSMWMNPDLKIYNSDIWLDAEDPNLRTGMSCKVEIIVAEYSDSIYVPITSVIRVEGKPTVFVVKPDGTQEERKVEVGLDNNIMIRVISGLSEGEVVSMSPPLNKANASQSGFQDDSGDANSANSGMSQRISQRLSSAGGPDAAGGPQTEGRRGGRGGRGTGGMRGSFDPNSLTPAERQRMEAMRKTMESLSPEERQQMMQSMGGGRGRGTGTRGEGQMPGQGPGQGRSSGLGGQEGGR
jgi:HlyD family secretion protein